MSRTSTMKGKQSVAYRMLSDEGFKSIINLPKAPAKLLSHIIDNADKKDNCCQLTPKELIYKYQLNSNNCYTHIRKLKSLNWLKEVLDIYKSPRLMVNPEMIAWQSRDLVKFTILMYSLGSHNEAIKHLDMENKCRGRININTGEHFDWYRNGLERADHHYGRLNNEDYEYINVGHTKEAEELPVPNPTPNVGDSSQSPFDESHDYSHEYDDYDDAWRYRCLPNAVLSKGHLVQTSK